MEYKKCAKCGIILSVDKFAKDKSTKSGLQSYCNLCHKYHFKNYYENNKEAILARTAKNRKAYQDTLNNYYVLNAANLDKNSPQELIDIAKTRIKIKRIKRLIRNEKERRKITV